MTSRAHGAPPPQPDISAIPVVRGGGYLSPTSPVPIGPGGAAVPYVPPEPNGVEVLPWWYQQWESAPAWAVQDLNFTVPLGAQASTTGLLPLASFSYQCPQQNRAIVKSIRMSVQNPVSTISLLLTLFLNGYPVQGWTNIPFDPVSATAYILVFNDVNVRLDQNQTLTAGFTESSNPASAWTCSLTASGWQVPISEIKRIQKGFVY